MPGAKSGRTCLLFGSIAEGGAVRGAVLQSPEGEIVGRKRSEVWCSRRGLPARQGTSPQRCSRTIRDGESHFSPAPLGNTGDGLRMGEEIGAALELGYPNAAAWVPVSRVPRKDGTLGRVPALHRPRQAGADRGFAERQAVRERSELIP